MKENEGAVAVFDSGLGGISVLAELVRELPHEDFIYFGDCANAPYGTRSVDEVRELTFAVYKRLKKENIKACVIACNTATSAAARELRLAYPDDIIVGVEPALKPAAVCKPHPTVAVLATPLTLSEEKFSSLLERYSQDARVIPFACPGLVEFVEDGITEGAELEAFLSDMLEPLTHEKLDAVVLGCTHYPFVREAISHILGEDVVLFDGSVGTARETRRRLAESGLLSPSEEQGSVVFMDSNYPDVIDPKASNVTRFGGKYLCR